MRSLIHPTDLDALIDASHDRPQFLFKHSTACMVSAQASAVVTRAAESIAEADFWRLLVIQDRDLSHHIAEQSGIPHQSPQVLLFDRGRVVWNGSHFAIREASLRGALEKTASGDVAAAARRQA